MMPMAVVVWNPHRSRRCRGRQAYFVRDPLGTGSEGDEVPAHRILHLKANVDSLHQAWPAGLHAGARRPGTRAANASQHGRGRRDTNGHRLGEPVCHGDGGSSRHADPCGFGLHATQARRPLRQADGCGELRAGHGDPHGQQPPVPGGSGGHGHCRALSRWNKRFCAAAERAGVSPNTSPATPATTTWPVRSWPARRSWSRSKAINWNGECSSVQ
jgi:hypothetical protein